MMPGSASDPKSEAVARSARAATHRLRGERANRISGPSRSRGWSRRAIKGAFVRPTSLAPDKEGLCSLCCARGWVLTPLSLRVRRCADLLRDLRTKSYHAGETRLSVPMCRSWCAATRTASRSLSSTAQSSRQCRFAWGDHFVFGNPNAVYRVVIVFQPDFQCRDRKLLRPAACGRRGEQCSAGAAGPDSRHPTPGWRLSELRRRLDPHRRRATGRCLPQRDRTRHPVPFPGPEPAGLELPEC